MTELTCTWACRLNIFGCDKTALELFQRWMATKDPDENNPIQLSNDLHLTAYCAAISRGGAEHWHFLKARLRRAKEDIREILLKALCCSRDVWILVHYMETSIMNGTDVTLQDADTVFSSILTTSSGFPVAKEFIYNKIENIHTALYAQESLGNIVTSLLAQFYKKQQLDEFLVWQDTNAKYLTNYTKDITDGIELAKKKIEWVDRHQTVIFEKLQELTDYEDLYGS